MGSQLGDACDDERLTFVGIVERDREFGLGVRGTYERFLESFKTTPLSQIGNLCIYKGEE